MTSINADAKLPVIRVSARTDGVPGLNFAGGEKDLTDFVHKLGLPEGESLLCNIGFVAVAVHDHEKLKLIIERMQAMAPTMVLQDVLSSPVDFDLLASEVTARQTPTHSLQARSIETAPRVASYNSKFVLEHCIHY